MTNVIGAAPSPLPSAADGQAQQPQQHLHAYSAMFGYGTVNFAALPGQPGRVPTGYWPMGMAPSRAMPGMMNGQGMPGIPPGGPQVQMGVGVGKAGPAGIQGR
jgi:hypothetical protein